MRTYNIHQNQRGAVLILALIMLALMMIVGVSSIRGSNLQEQMAGNMREYQISFQAAESGLRVAEFAVNQSSFPDVSDGTLPGFIGTQANGGQASFWEQYDWSSAAGSIEANVALQITAANPRYVVEDFAVWRVPMKTETREWAAIQELPNKVFYRITVRGVGMSTNTESYIQSIFHRQ